MALVLDDAATRRFTSAYQALATHAICEVTRNPEETT
jgi:hypothetical protein